MVCLCWLGNVVIICTLVALAFAFAIKLYYKLIRFGKYQITEDLTGKVVVITGGSAGNLEPTVSESMHAGIGKATASELAKHGARVYMGCRNLEKGRKAAEEIKHASLNAQVFVLHLDLEDFNSVHEFAKNYDRLENRLDVLINNAGRAGNPGEKEQLTKDGLEITMQANYFGHFLLTNLLLEKLKATAPSRIINVASVMHAEAKMDVTNPVTLQADAYSSRQAYCCSKLANVLFTKALASRLTDTGVSTNSLCPGFVWTDIFLPPMRRKLRFWRLLLAKNPLEGAQTTLFCALAPELENVSGWYFVDCKPAVSSLLSLNEQLAENLWKLSAAVTGASLGHR